MERPVLTARWTELLLLNFHVPVELIARFAPPGTEPDLHDGLAYLSIVGFRFQDVRFLGLSWPGHTRFVEINLRYYVRRVVDGELRRGVVFVKEIAPRRAVCITANWLYNESYIARPMLADICQASAQLAEGDTIEYAWQSRCRRRMFNRDLNPRWNRLAARLAQPPAIPPPGSLDEFIIEHYWGYVRGRDGQTREYQVVHEPWRAAPADNLTWECDLADAYDEPWGEFLCRPPASALIADGSAVNVFHGRRI